MPRVHHLKAYVADMEGEWYLRADVARALDVTKEAVEAAGEAHPELGPSGMVTRHTQVIHLYSPEDVDRLSAYFNRQGDGRGRRRIFTAAQTRDRDRIRDLLRFHRRQALRYAAARDHKRAARSRARVKALERELAVGRKQAERNPAPQRARVSDEQ